MIVYVNQSTNLIDNSGLNVVPITLETDIVLKNTVYTSTNQKIDENGNLLYKSDDSEETISEWNIDKINSSFEDFDFSSSQITKLGSNPLSSIDEDIKYATIEFNEPVLEDVPFIELVAINEDNVKSFDINYIMDIEIANILEASEYDNSIYKLLEDIIYSKSNYIYKNKYNVLLGPNDNLYLNITEIKETNNIELELHGIDTRAKVYVNEYACKQVDDVFKISITNTLTSKLSINIINTTDSIMEVKNPYILMR